VQAAGPSEVDKAKFTAGPSGLMKQKQTAAMTQVALKTVKQISAQQQMSNDATASQVTAGLHSLTAYGLWPAQFRTTLRNKIALGECGCHLILLIFAYAMWSVCF